MTFKESENLNLANPEIKEAKREQSVENLEEELIDLCARHGNPIIIHRSGTEMPKEIPALRDFEDDQGNGEYKDTLKFIQEGMIRFLHSPIFTDTFHQNHPSRRVWEGIEADKKEVENELFAKGLYDYYNSNGLNTHCWSVIEMLKDLSHFSYAHYPPKLIEQLDEIFNQYADYIPDKEVYDHASDEEKIAYIAKIELVIKEILKVIHVESEN